LKKGICEGCIPGSGLGAQRLRQAQAAGYAGVEVTVARGGQGALHVGSSRAEAQAALDAVRQAGLELPGTGAGVMGESPLLHGDPAVRARGVAGLQATLERTAWVGAATVLVHPGHLAADRRYDAAFDDLVSALRALRSACDATGVALAVENVWNRFLVSPREMRELVDAVDHPLIGAYFDVGNCLLFGYAAGWIDVLGRRIKKVHVKDFKRSVGNYEGFCQLLDGDADYPRVMAALRGAGYAGYLTSEVSGDIAETSRRIDRILQL